MITLEQKKKFCKKIKNISLLNRKIMGDGCMSDAIQAVHEVYNGPFTKRTIKGIGALNIDDILKELAFHIHTLFEKGCQNQAEFDEFVFKYGNWFVEEFNKIATANGVENINFGKAQKLINITFKYLSCFSDSDNYSQIFSFCHMPIDAYILRQFKDKLNLENIKYSIWTNKKTGKKQLTSSYKKTAWSNLTEDFYKELLTNSRKEIKNKSIYNGKTLLEIEFDWWEELAN